MDSKIDGIITKIAQDKKVPADVLRNRIALDEPCINMIDTIVRLELLEHKMIRVVPQDLIDRITELAKGLSTEQKKK